MLGELSIMSLSPAPSCSSSGVYCFSYRGITFSRHAKSAQSNYQRQNGIIVSVFREFRQRELNDQTRRVIFILFYFFPVYTDVSTKGFGDNGDKKDITL